MGEGEGNVAVAVVAVAIVVAVSVVVWRIVGWAGGVVAVVVAVDAAGGSRGRGGGGCGGSIVRMLADVGCESVEEGIACRRRVRFLVLVVLVLVLVLVLLRRMRLFLRMLRAPCVPLLEQQRRRNLLQGTLHGALQRLRRGRGGRQQPAPHVLSRCETLLPHVHAGGREAERLE